MRESPFAKKVTMPVQQPVQASPLAVATPTKFGQGPKALPIIRYTADDIDQIGAQPGKRNAELTDRVTKKMTLNRMGGIGELLADIEMKANSMNPGNLMKRDGVMGWLQQRFLDVRKELMTRFTTVDEAFTKLLEGMASHVTVLRDWERDDEAMYQENWQRFREFMDAKKQIEAIIFELQTALKSWPEQDPTDPEGVMKAQQKLAVDELLNRAEVRRDSIMRSMVKCETNGPEILMMKSVSSKLIAKLTNDATDVVPEIKREIAKEIQRLNFQDAATVSKSFKDFANATLTQGAQKTKEMILEGNKLFNEATVTVGTITTIQTSVRDMVVGAQQIMDEARKKRDEEQQQIAQQQAALLKDLQKHGAV